MKKQELVDRFYCDFCGKPTTKNHHCIICGKDVCSWHATKITFVKMNKASPVSDEVKIYVCYNHKMGEIFNFAVLEEG